MAGLSASTGNYIASYTVTGSASSGFTFNNIPQNYTDLLFVVSGPGDTGGSIVVRANGDTAGNYSRVNMYGSGTSANSGRAASESAWYFNVGTSSTVTSSARINIMSYSNSNMFKTLITEEDVGSGNPSSWVYNWRSYNPITSLVIAGSSGSSIVVGTTFTIYGIKAADTTVIIPTKAYGGDVIATDGTYTYHAFKNSGVFTTAGALTADVLVVAGGGAGGGSGGGGGGAGGVIAFATQSLASGSSTTCTVGAGGAGGYSQTLISGSNSQFGALTLAGYGTGGNGTAGASAGSASGSPTTFNGGTGNTSGYPCGGGGGAGGAGGNNSGQTGGAGGAGLATVTNWGSLSTALTTLGLGVNGYIAGGGGGGGGKTGGPNNGGAATAGGGNGGYGYGSGNAGGGAVGLPGTGGGGGGGGVASGTDGPGGAGGSGVIIVRYAV
jgi:hypothetical protein